MTLLSGCGAMTARVGIGPTLDTTGKPGFESMLTLGVGTPLDFHGRSHHFFQAASSVGGGMDSQTKKASVLLAQDFDYIYWAEPRLDVRAGMRLSFRSVPAADQGSGVKLYGFGAHMAFMPIVWHHDGGWLVSQFNIGPDLRLDYLWSDPGGYSRGQFSVPLGFELNGLGAGD
jgi:hypothetical protein